MVTAIFVGDLFISVRPFGCSSVDYPDCGEKLQGYCNPYTPEGISIMPYIAPKERKHVEGSIETLIKNIHSAGTLNYIITRLCSGYLAGNQVIGYTQMNEVVGVLECAKLEFNRRPVSTYENKKMKENGDVYPVSFNA